MPTIYIAEETFPCILNELRVVLQGLGQVPLPGLAYLYALLAAETLDDDMASNDLRPDFAFDDDLGPDFAFDTRSSPTAVDTSPATSLVSSPAPAPSSCPSSPEPSLYSPSPTLGLSRHPSSFIPSLNLQQGSAPAADAHLGEPHPYPLRKRAHVTSNSESEELDSGFNGASHNASSTTNKRPRLLPGGDGGGDGGDDGEDPGHVVNWDITCRRNGNRSRVKGPGTGPGIVCEMAEEDDERGLFAFLHDQHGYEGDNDDDDEDDTQQDGNYEPPSAKIDHYINDNDDTYDNNVDYDDLPASDDANDEANTAPTTKHTRRKQPRQEDDADYIPPANKGRSKGENTGKKSRTWRKGARLPTISAAARRRIVTLCTITTKDPLDKLAQLVLSFSANQSIAVPEPEQQSPADDLAPLRALAIRCDELEVNVHRTELDFMITLIQLTLAVDVIRKGFTDKDCPSVGALGSQIGFTPNKFRDWVAHGTRLAYLVAAGTPWILLVIAALGMRACLTRRQDTVTEDIYSIAFTLRQPQDAERQFRSPMRHSLSFPNQHPAIAKSTATEKLTVNLWTDALTESPQTISSFLPGLRPG
ncbi:hypothetical protein FPV67DRAFT_1672104 [Lyophyllum atratum]|nr:hypothetical protein FPV67DRAFT_1672104 [Lyophyllum atratum]